MSETSTVSFATAGRVDPQPDGFICQLSDGPRKLRLTDACVVGTRAQGRRLAPRREVAPSGRSQVVPVIWLSAATADIKLAELDDTNPATRVVLRPSRADRAA